MYICNIYLAIDLESIYLSIYLSNDKTSVKNMKCAFSLNTYSLGIKLQCKNNSVLSVFKRQTQI